MREQGYSTQKREKILAFLLENQNRTVTIQDILDFMQQEQIEINISTIYRYLEKLEKQGLVLKNVNGKREQASFQYVGNRSECHNHLHMKCSVCGLVFHLDCGFMAEIRDHIMEDHGFSINCEDSFLTGICAACRTGKKSVDEEYEHHGHCCSCGCEENKIHHM